MSPDNPPVEAFIKIYGEVGVNRPPTVPYGRLSVSMPVPRPYSAAVLVPGQIGVYRVDLSAPSELPESALAGCFNNFTSAFSNYAYSLVAGVSSTQELGSVSYAPLPVCVKESPSTFESIKTEAARLKTVTHQ